MTLLDIIFFQPKFNVGRRHFKAPPVPAIMLEATSHMTLESSLRQSARACEGAAVALAHSLHRAANSPEATTTVLEIYREAEAFAITVGAVLDEAAPILPLLRDESKCIGRGEGIVEGRVKNGFDAIAAVLEALFDNSVDAILDVGGNVHRWGMSPLQKVGGFERMVVHHGQLRALYGLLHLAAKVVGGADTTKTLFVDIDGEGGVEPGKWRSAIKMDDFYGRYFGFHYRPEMRNVLRVVNIARESVHKTHEEGGGNVLIKNVAMLGWGWLYSNMVLMNNLGFGMEGVEQIGANEGGMSIAALRKFMNLVEEPIVTGVSGLASADVAVNRAFEIPPPGAEGGLEEANSPKHEPLLREVLMAIEDPVCARVMSVRHRPLDLPRAKGRKKTPSKASVEVKSTGKEKGDVVVGVVHRKTAGDATQITKGLVMGRSGEIGEGSGNSVGEVSMIPEVPENMAAKTIAGSKGKSYLADTLKTELTRLHNNMSTFLGIEEAKVGSGLIMHFHGGGFVSQSSESHAVYMKEWCAELADAVLVSIDYKLAPEYKFPTAVYECVYAYIWALQNAKRLGCLCDRVVFAGDSAGGNLAIVTALKIAELGIRVPDGICIAYPALYMSLAVSPSRLLSFFDPLLPLSVLELCVKSYLPEGELDKGREWSMLSPVVAKKEELKRLPRICMVCGSLDPLLDDAVMFAQRLKAVDGRKGDVLRVYESMPHGFLNLIQVNETAREGMRFMANHIAKYLGQEGLVK